MSRLRPQAVAACCTIALGAAAAATAGAVPGAGTSARAGTLLSATTADRNANGRVDQVTVRIRGRAGRTAVRALKVKGYRVSARSARTSRKATTVRLTLREGKRPDTAARPLVSTKPSKGSASRTARRKARDGAAPAMVAAQLTAGPGDTARAVGLFFSEPIYFGGATSATSPLSVSGHRVVSLGRARRSLTLTGDLADAGAQDSALVRLQGVKGRPAPRDAARNAAVATQARVPVPSRNRSPVVPARPVPSPAPTPNPTPGPTPNPTPTPEPEPPAQSGWRTLSNPIDPRQQTQLPFGQRSHWLQPWRAYLDTPPASQLRDAVGINFNVGAEHAEGAAEGLADSGFTRGRIEADWADMSYEDPTRMDAQERTALRTKLTAMKRHGIRPLILLNSNHNKPTAAKFFTARITQPVTPGSRTVQVDSATADQMVPGLSGFNGFGGKAADYLVTAVSSTGRVTLSKPIPVAVPAAEVPAATLRYAPFAAPKTSSGAPNPSFERTLRGWLEYVRAVTSEAESALGGQEFDVEVWNEVTFGADFLSADRYYDPVPASMSGTGDVQRELLDRTVAFLRDPANGVSEVGISDGFANQNPFPAGSTSPRGLTALGKHPYHAGVKTFPRDSPIDGIRATDAQGSPAATPLGTDRWRDNFTPNYRAFFPEYYLSGIQTEYMVRDISPLTTKVGDTEHGRQTKPDGASKAPEVWITETNIDPDGGGDFTAADKRHLQAKATLRSLSAFVNKGVTGMYFYGATGGDFAMVDPGAPGGGETIRSVKRMTEAFESSSPLEDRRALTLGAIADDHDHKQFEGDGTAAHPPLYNRDVVAFLPFQVDDHKFVAPSYVMTRDMGKLHKPGAPASDTSRYDLPPENYRLTVGGIDGDKLRARATDPLTGSSVPVSVVSRTATSAVVQVPLTDSPRLLVLEDD